MKHPLPSPPSVPACYAFEHDPRDRVCRRCPVAETCAPTTERWRKCGSLTRSVAELEAQLAAPTTIGQEHPEAVYDRLHREILGKPSRRRDNDRNRDVFRAVLAHCLRNDYDLATYIAGGMWAMKPWVENNPSIGFQPNHLLGEKAEARYHAYRGQQKRRYRRQRVDLAHTRSTRAGALRQELYAGEVSVAEVYVTEIVYGGRMTWDDAIAEAGSLVPDTYRAAYHSGGHRARYAELCNAFGTTKLPLELLLARLRAARDIANRYQHGLADAVAFRSFDWPSFARLMARMFPIEPCPALDLAGIEGVEWGRG